MTVFYAKYYHICENCISCSVSATKCRWLSYGSSFSQNL